VTQFKIDPDDAFFTHHPDSACAVFEIEYSLGHPPQSIGIFYAFNSIDRKMAKTCRFFFQR
jgi:hypothetical protein